MVANFDSNRQSPDFGRSMECFIADIEAKEIDFSIIQSFQNDKRLKSVAEEMTATLNFMKFKRKILTEINSLMAEELFSVAGAEYSRYPEL